ncbi:MAG: polysaccharide biosynthesis/export family protein [Planctomycetota bacterium]|jgi:polysaccharide export outer membrane protein
MMDLWVLEKRRFRRTAFRDMLNRIKTKSLAAAVFLVFLSGTSCTVDRPVAQTQDVYMPQAQESMQEEVYYTAGPKPEEPPEILEHRIGEADVLGIQVWQKVVKPDKELAVTSRTQTKRIGKYIAHEGGELSLPESLPDSLEYAIDAGDVLQIDVWQKVTRPLLSNSPTLVLVNEEEMEAPEASEYIIDEGDVLYIDIWGEEGLKQEVTVRPDGRVSFPLAGDVFTKGLTFSELKEQLTLRLKEYVRYPTVIISLRKPRAKKVSVLEKTLYHEITVRPDGRISFPLAGDLFAAGLTFGQLKERLTERLEEYIDEPLVSVYLKESRVEKAIALEETLNQEVIVRPGGRISFPLAGDVFVAGLTFAELKEELTQRLEEHINYPIVTVSLKSLGGRKVIVLGQVNSPGVYTVTGKNTIWEAIALAGGLTQDAVTSSTILISGGLRNPVGRKIDLTPAIKKADASQNIVLHAEDIIYVPRTFIADASHVINQILTPVSKGIYTARSIEFWDRYYR